MLHDISYLKFITYYSKLKTFLKGSKSHLGFGLIIGFLISYLFFLFCAIVELILGSYKISLGLWIYALLPLALTCMFSPHIIYKVYNSRTYAINKLKYNSNYVILKFNHKSYKYFIITSLKNGNYLVQDKKQINDSDKFPVSYKIFNPNKSSDQISKNTYSCSEQINKNSKGHCRTICFDIFLITFGMMIVMILILSLFRLILGVKIIKELL